jgi:hypothetical protein
LEEHHTPSAQLGLPYTPLPSSHRNRFGGALGGPLTPRFWGGKSYFFVNYEGYRFPNSSTLDRGVPSALLRAGVIQIQNSSGLAIHILDRIERREQAWAIALRAHDKRGLLEFGYLSLALRDLSQGHPMPTRGFLDFRQSVLHPKDRRVEDLAKTLGWFGVIPIMKFR